MCIDSVVRKKITSTKRAGTSHSHQHQGIVVEVVVSGRVASASPRHPNLLLPACRGASPWLQQLSGADYSRGKPRPAPLASMFAQAAKQLCTGSQEVGHKFLGYLAIGRTELRCQLFKEVMGPARWPAPQNQASPLSRERWSFNLALPLAHTVSLGFLCVARFH